MKRKLFVSINARRHPCLTLAASISTYRLLQVLYNDNGGQPQDGTYDSWVKVLREMKRNLAAMGYSQVPQLSSSRLIDVNKPMTVVKHPSGTKRAVLIGINYVGQNGELSVSLPG